MKKILLAIVIFSMLALPAWGVSIKTSNAAGKSIRGSGVTNLPTMMPILQKDNVYGWQTTDAIAKNLQGAEVEDESKTADTATSASVTVTATVLPVRTLVVVNGEIAEVWGNTTDPMATDCLYHWVNGKLDGPSITLNKQLWQDSKLALHNLRPNKIGKVWSK